MEKLRLYVVTKGSSDGTFKAGDVIWLSQNGDLNNCNGGGWLSEEEWKHSKTCDFEVEPSKEYYLEVRNGSEKVYRMQIKENFTFEWINRMKL